MQTSKPFKKHPIALAIQAMCYSMLLNATAQAAPARGAVVGGNGTINQSGTNTTINQTTQNMAINWQSYNVTANEHVQYIQPNASSVSLNRILSNDGSMIAGRIDANGRVILVNPNGILFTPTASINVGSLIASGLDIKPTDFMNGNYIFNEIPGTQGKVINSGIINASLGGNATLIGKQVQNNGLISANLGTVTMAAGKQAVLTFDNDGLLGVKITKEVLQSELGIDPAVLNNGTIQAQGGKVLLTASISQDIFSKAVNTNGIQQATSVVVNSDGTFTLGNGADVVNTGTIDTSTTAPNQSVGRIVLIGQDVTNSGTLKADAKNGNAGDIELHAKDTTLLTQHSLTSARSEANGNGGIVKVLGDKVGLFDQSKVDVSGANGGGQALIGGDLHGTNTNIRNATTTVVDRNTKIYADALQKGNGGKVVVWADNTTKFLGNIFARGGAVAGNGGFVETSGKQNLLFDGLADRSAVNGTSGTLLLDPANITIQSCGGGGTSCSADAFTATTAAPYTLSFAASPSSYVLSPTTLSSNLSLGDVLLQATTNITVSNSVSNPGNTSAHTLTLEAGDDIYINNTLNLGINNLTLISGSAGCGTTCGGTGTTHDINVYNPIRTSGAVLFEAADNVNIYNTIGSTSTLANDPSSLTIRAGNDITMKPLGSGGSTTYGSIHTNGAVSMTAADTTLTGGASPITVAPNATSVTGAIGLNGDVITNGGNFTATTTKGYFDNWFDTGRSLNVGAGNVSITTTGTRTFSGFAGGAFLGNITTTGSGTLLVKTTGGGITQSATDPTLNLNIAGTASFDAGAHAIELQNSVNNLQGTINLANTATTTPTGITANNITLVNAPTTGTTTLGTITAGGALKVTADQNLTLAANIANTFATGTTNLKFGNGGADSAFTANSGLTLSPLTVTGGTGIGTFTLNSLFTGTVNGNGGGADTLIGPDAAATNHNDWAISSGGGGTLSQSGTNSPALGTVTFTGMSNLTGGSGDDIFNFTTPPLTAAVFIRGGGSPGVDTINLNVATPVSIQLGPTAFFTGIEAIHNIGAGVGTLIGDNTSNTWNVTAPNTGNINDGTTTTAFSGFGNLTGGTGADNFVIGIAGTIASIDGGTGSGINTLQGRDGANTWGITATNSGTLSDTATPTTPYVTFTNIQNLLGGNGTDTFTFGTFGALTGWIDGGASSTDSVALNALGLVDVQLRNGANPAVNSSATLTVTNVETITADPNFVSTLIGDDATNTWTISGPNIGNVNQAVAFNGFRNLTGGNQSDTFVMQTGGSIGGLIDGGLGTGINTLDMAALPTVNVTLGPVIIGTTAIANINQLIGNNTDSTLTGDNTGDTWAITGINSGSVAYTSSSGAATMAFRGFNNLVGGNGSGNDIYNVSSNAGNTTYGSLTGSITDTVGTNHLNVDVSNINAMTGTGQIAYHGNTSDSVTISGTAPSGWTGSYTPAVNGYDQIAYANPNTTSTFNVNYQSVGAVTDNANASNFTINGTTGVDTMTLGATSTGVNTFKLDTAVNTAFAVAYTNKQNVTINGGPGDKLLQASNTILTLPSLTLLNVGNVNNNNGTALQTDIGTLSIVNSGPVKINEANALILGPVNATSLIDITAHGAVSSTAPLVSTAAFNINSTGNDIALTGNNALSGPLSFTGSNVTFNNGIATHFAAVNANNLTVTSGGDITQTGAIVAPVATFTAAGHNIVLNDANNDFSNLTVTAAATVSVTDQNSIGQGSLTAADITLNTQTGVGGQGAPITTNTAHLTVNNSTSGGVYVTNNGNATIGIVNNGDIGLTNNGNLTIDKLYTSGPDFFNKGQYHDIVLSVNNGSIQAMPQHTDYTTVPDVAAHDFTVVVQGGGGIGNVARPLSLSVTHNFSYLGGHGFVYYLGNQRPEFVTTGADLVSFSALDILTSLQLLQIESLGEFDPAIFTEVRNYYYEDVAIMMPADQRLDATDEAETEEERQKPDAGGVGQK